MALEGISAHKIDGFTFQQLTEEYLRELFPLLGDRVKIKRLICELLNPQSQVGIRKLYVLMVVAIES